MSGRKVCNEAGRRLIMRAREPDQQGHLDRDGVRIAYEVFGAGETTVVFVPMDPFVHSRAWKAQVPYLARTCRVVTVDPRGNGRSDRPSDPSAYGDLEYVADTFAVMDALGIGSAVLVGACSSAWWSLLCAALHPDRVQAVVAVAPWALDSLPRDPEKADAVARFEEVRSDDQGWAKLNRHYWRRDWPGYADFFFTEICHEPHSTKLIEDLVAYACESDGETQLAAADATWFPETPAEADRLLAGISCPVLVIHGTDDRCQPYARGERLAELTGGQVVGVEGAGHVPQGRDPVLVNLVLSEFLDQIEPRRRVPARRWTRAADRRRRALFLSSPIGLGHARRDLAVVREFRTLRRDVEVDWLTQEPVVGFLERAGERVHPASAALANETRHFEGCAGEHDLHAFQAIRDMDEVMVANFMVFHDTVAQEKYDLVIGDEAWDVDHFLHENPELKRTAFAWMTDFVGWVPMPDGGDREAFLTADYNAEMVEHVARYPRLRDRAIFVGDPEDVVGGSLGPGLPAIRDWTEEHFEFSGYITGIDGDPGADRYELRDRLGYRPEEKVCVVSVGGSGVGKHLLRRVIDAYPAAKERVPELRMVVVAGPRIHPGSLPARDGLEILGFVPDLHLHHAACDLGIVQGGLTTTMELTAANRPFLYFPLRHHFEQNIHVAHRLDRHGAGRRMDYGTADPDEIAAAVVEEIGREVKYLDVPTDGAARAAALLAALV
jgi:pimeloyl-ACP methyl ester carboxylesterase/predicted glycosyltransferase